MTDLFAPVLMVHVAAGLAATAVGIVPVLTRKGAFLHRLFGRVFAATMGLALVCAWTLTALRFDPYFAGLSANATLQLVSGLRVLCRKRPDLRAQDRARAVDWLVALGVTAVAVWLLVLLQGGGLAGGAPVCARPIAMALAISGVMFGGWDLWRFCRPTAFPFFPELWRYEHLVKMLGAYSAVMSAFAGNFLRVLPEPWSQMWPIMLFEALTIVFVVRQARRPRQSAETAAA